MVEFARSATMKDEEYVDVLKNSISPTRKFQERIAQWEAKSLKERKPFCRACAWASFNDAAELLKKKLERDFGAANDFGKEFYELVKEMDLDEFYGEQYFELVKTSEASQQETINGSKINRQIGWFLNYACKVSRGIHQHTVFLTMEEMEQRKLKK